MRPIWRSGFLLFLLALTGCSVIAQFQSTPTPAPTETPTLTPTSAFTATPSPEPTATLTPTATPFVPFQASVWADNVNVRQNPGYLFKVLGVVPKDTAFTVLGKSPGGEWIQVRTQNDTLGWVFAKLMQADLDLQLAPVVEPKDVLTITGKVQDQQGEPVSGIGFAIVQGVGDNAPRTDAATNEFGMFYAFLPSASSGSWYVSYTSIACTSNKMDADCNCIGGVCGSPEPLTKLVTLPQDEMLVYLWK